MRKRILALCLCITMILGMVPMDAFATSAEPFPVESEILEEEVLEEEILEEDLEEEDLEEETQEEETQEEETQEEETQEEETQEEETQEEETQEEETQEEETQEEETPVKEGMTADELAEMFRNLPSASDVTQDTSEEEKEAMMAQLEEAVSAYDAMLENNPEEAALFEETYAQLYLDAMDLNDALTGNISELYADYDYSYNANGSNVTITVYNENGQTVTDATITVTDTYGNTYEVRSQGNGQYKFTKASSSSNRQYTITVSHTDYVTKEETVNKYTTRTIIILEEKQSASSDVWETFGVFYISTGEFPDTYNGGGDISNYGPSSNNTPLVYINVNVTKLMRDHSDVVTYGKPSSRQWYYIPKGPAKNLEASTAFWNAVKDCMDEESIRKFKATGLYDDFVLYCIKKQSDGSQHADGILKVTSDKSYVFEYYYNGTYFGGAVAEENGNFKKLADVKAAYSAHAANLGYSIIWGSGLTGIYQTSDNIYTITISQTNAAATGDETHEDIRYKKVNSAYYLATFNSTIREGADGYHTVTYTDGVVGQTLFANDTHIVNGGVTVPAFAANVNFDTIYQGYSFDGWALEGGTGEYAGILTADKIATMTVDRNMVFHAQWSLKPTEFEATINVTLDDAAKYITDILDNQQAKLYVKEDKDGAQYYELERTATTGEYKKNLPKGTYFTYYSLDGGSTYVPIDERPFSIGSAAGGREVKYYSVKYNLDGGTWDSAIPAMYYHHAGTAVEVTSTVPHRDDYIFKGWENTDGTNYESDSLLTNNIVKPYALTAQWEKAVDVKVTVVINHGNDTTENNDLVNFSLVESRGGTTIHTGSSKSLSETSCEGFTFNKNETVRQITYTPIDITFNDLPNADYTLNCFKAGYKSSVVKKVESDDVQHITLTLDYAPEFFTLEFDVQMDNNAMGYAANIRPQTWPKAVHVKAVRWDGTNWVIVPQHENTSVRVEIDTNTGMGSGQVNVPQYWPGMSDKKADYRVMVTAYIMPDGTLVSASEQSDKFVSSNDIYSGVVTIEGGGRTPSYPSDANVKAAYYSDSVQKGTPTVTVSVKSYSVTFDAKGGTVEGKTSYEVSHLFKIPEFKNYSLGVPKIGYVFDGWYSKDGTNGDWGEKIVAGTILNESITVYAKWKAPRTISGTVYVAGSYEQNGVPVSIHDYDRAKAVTAVLREVGVGGYVKSTPVAVTYTDDLGSGTYEFVNVPDDGRNYYIEVNSPNYSSYYQNEPESLSDTPNFDTYAKNDYYAVYGGTGDEPGTATINAYLKFAPASFDLHYEIDATAISDGFRPSKAEVKITYKDGTANPEPSLWTVISQMVSGGKVTPLTNGLGSDSTSVWNSHLGGSILYEYGMRVVDTNPLTYTGTELPYHVNYEAPAYYKVGGQSKMLKATLIPNEYAIRYELGIDSTAVTGMSSAPNRHTWSFPTNINVIPVRSGYEFLGWYADKDFTGDPVKQIDASIAKDITLYAKWLQTQDVVDMTVTINHSTGTGSDAGIAGNYDKDLIVQLTQSLKNSGNPYEDAAGKKKSYSGDQWHTTNENIESDVFSVNRVFSNLSSAYAYNLNAQLEGYVVTSKQVTANVDAESGITTYKVDITMQYVPDLLNLTVNAKIADGIAEELKPVSAEVKINCWYDYPDNTVKVDWHTITQHDDTTLTIRFDNDGKGQVSYPVWQWLDKENEIPYYYRMEVVSLHLKDDTIVKLSGGPESYAGVNYFADIVTSGCEVPDGQNDTTLTGAYGTKNGDNYNQNGTVTAIISTNKAKIIFRSGDETKGTVTGNTSQSFALGNKTGYIYTDTVTPETVTTTPKSGYYKFSHWTNDNGVIVDPFGPQNISSGKIYTYTAHWEVREYQYTVKCIDKDSGNVLEEYVEDNQGFNTKVTVDAPDITGYIHDGVASQTFIIDEDNKVITFYYNIRRDLELTVKYRELNGDPNVEIHDDIKVNNLIYNYSPDLSMFKIDIKGFVYIKNNVNNESDEDNDFRIGTGTNEITMYYSRVDCNYRVEYYYDDQLDSTKTVHGTVPYRRVINSYEQKPDGHILDYVTGLPLTVDTRGEDANVIRVYYASDTNGNETPDKYDATVTFRIRNGKWTAYPDGSTHTGDTADITKVYPLYRKDGNSWVSNNATIGPLPTGTVVSDAFISNGGIWSPALTANTPVTDKAVYTLNFKEKEYSIIATVVNGTASEYEKVVTHNDTDTTTITFAANQNHVLDTVYVDGIKTSLINNKYTFDHKGNHTIKVTYELDVVGGEHNGEDTGDTIPDKYQKKVNFVVVNGTWGNTNITKQSKYLTLRNGSATLIKPSNMTPATGYITEGAGWEVTPPSIVTDTREETFTYKFNKKEQITIVLEVVHGTSFPVHSTTVYDYDASEHDIVFRPNVGYVLDSAQIMLDDLSTGTWDDINWIDTSANGTTRYKHNHTSNQHIKVVYAKDSNGDKIADYKQAFVHFNSADAYGTVGVDNATQVFTFDSDSNYKGTKTPDTVTLTPAKGYKFHQWVNENGVIIDNPFVAQTFEGGKTYTFTAHWKIRTDYSYKVNYVDEDGNSLDTVNYSNVTYNTRVTAESMKKDIANHVYIRADKEELIIGSSDDDAYVYEMTLTYGKDHWKDDIGGNDSESGGDGVIDSKQALFLFITSDSSLGTLSGNHVTQVFTNTSGNSKVVVPTSVTLNPAIGYVLSHWTEKGDATNTPVNPFDPVNITGNMKKEYVAHWSKRSDLSYTVNYLDMDGNAIRVPSVEDEQTFGTTVNLADVNKPTIPGYAYDHGDHTSITINVDNNVINLYYAKDEWSDSTKDTDPNTPGDGIGDCYQVKVNYHAIPGQFGTVSILGQSGTVSRDYEILTILDGAGNLATSGDVQISGAEAIGNEANANGSYTFVNWTDSMPVNSLSRESNVISTDKVLSARTLNVSGGTEYHFYANFRFDMKLSAIYFVEHYFWDKAQNQYVLDEDATLVGRAYVNEKVSATAASYAGYVLNTSKSNMQGIVTQPKEDPTTLQPTNVLTLKFYYDVKPPKKDKDKSDKDKSDKDSGNTTVNTPQTNTVVSVIPVKTGDDSTIGMWIGIMITSCMVMIGSVFDLKKKSRNSDS